MAYEVQITRDPFGSRNAQRPRIHLEEWHDVVHRDAELQFAVPIPPDYHPLLFVQWTAHPEAASGNAPNSLYYSLGTLSTNYPDEPMIRKMVELAVKLKAVVMGDNGEFYQFDGNNEVVARDEGPPPAPEPLLYGFGAGFCRDLTAQVAANPATGAILDYTWYLGYLTSFSQARHARGEAVVNYPLNTERATEDQAFLRSYSAEHPDARFVQAVLALIRMHDLCLNS